MKIYRGPSTKDFYDPLTEQVAAKDLSGELEPWIDTMRVQVNITKDGTERQAVAYIELDEADVVSLYHALVQGWKDSARSSKAMEGEISVLQESVRKIRRAASYAEFEGEKEVLSQITSLANIALRENEM